MLHGTRHALAERGVELGEGQLQERGEVRDEHPARELLVRGHLRGQAKRAGRRRLRRAAAGGAAHATAGYARAEVPAKRWRALRQISGTSGAPVVFAAPSETFVTSFAVSGNLPSVAGRKRAGQGGGAEEDVGRRGGRFDDMTALQPHFVKASAPAAASSASNAMRSVTVTRGKSNCSAEYALAADTSRASPRNLAASESWIA